MNWFSLRQSRKQLLVFVLLLAAFAALLIPTGIHFWHVYQQALVSCQQNPATPSCSDLANSLFQGDGAIIDMVILGTFAAPMLLGVFLGSPLLAKEYEEGTNKLVWTQSVSRRRWLSVKLLWALGFALAYGAALTILVTWWSRTINAVQQNRFDTGMFDIQGLIPVVYSIFFTAVGIFLGAWFRKTMIAMALTLVVMVLCLASFGEWIRPHYMTPITITAPMGPGVIENKVPQGAWVLSRDILDMNGHSFRSFDLANMPEQCQQIIQQQTTGRNGGVIVKEASGSGDPIDTCLNKYGYHQIAKYQPSYRYWDFQEIESGIYLALSVIVISASYQLVLRRDA